MQQHLRCVQCGSTKIVKNGVVWSHRRRVQRYLCNHCGRLSIYMKKVQ